MVRRAAIDARMQRRAPNGAPVLAKKRGIQYGATTVEPWLEVRMTFARAAVFGIAIVSMAVAAIPAAALTYYDTQSHTWVTYDPDKVRNDAVGASVRTTRNAAGQTVVVVNKDRKVDPKFDKQVVAYDTSEAPGTVIIDTKDKFLYYVQEGGMALRMGVGVGREGFGWSGTVFIGSKQENPKWFPPPEMIARQPELAKYSTTGMDGGEGNPLGVRALYLNDEKGKDTLYRIHGTIEPWSIGLNVSSGCIRMLNENVTELFDLVPIGTKVIVM
jgi:lipoprotein-anchoring transpeptidase ErfK/SrfK